MVSQRQGVAPTRNCRYETSVVLSRKARTGRHEDQIEPFDLIDSSDRFDGTGDAVEGALE